MEVTYGALTTAPLGCIEFYGITILPPDDDVSSETLCLVFERATEGTIVEYLNKEGKWEDVVGLLPTQPMRWTKDFLKGTLCICMRTATHLLTC